MKKKLLSSFVVGSALVATFAFAVSAQHSLFTKTVYEADASVAEFSLTNANQVTSDGVHSVANPLAGDYLVDFNYSGVNADVASRYHVSLAAGGYVENVNALSGVVSLDYSVSLSSLSVYYGFTKDSMVPFKKFPNASGSLTLPKANYIRIVNTSSSSLVNISNLTIKYSKVGEHGCDFGAPVANDMPDSWVGDYFSGSTNIEIDEDKYVYFYKTESMFEFAGIIDDGYYLYSNDDGEFLSVKVSGDTLSLSDNYHLNNFSSYLSTSYKRLIISTEISYSLSGKWLKEVGVDEYEMVAGQSYTLTSSTNGTDNIQIIEELICDVEDTLVGSYSGLLSDYEIYDDVTLEITVAGDQFVATFTDSDYFDGVKLYADLTDDYSELYFDVDDDLGFGYLTVEKDNSDLDCHFSFYLYETDEEYNLIGTLTSSSPAQEAPVKYVGGKYVANAAGTATIRLYSETDDTLTKEISLTVREQEMATDYSLSVKVGGAEVESVVVGVTASLEFTCTNPNADDSTFTVSVTSSNKSSASLSKTSFKATKAGEYTITLNSNDGSVKNKTFTIVVVEDSPQNVIPANCVGTYYGEDFNGSIIELTLNADGTGVISVVDYSDEVHSENFTFVSASGRDYTFISDTDVELSLTLYGDGDAELNSYLFLEYDVFLMDVSLSLN